MYFTIASKETRTYPGVEAARSVSTSVVKAVDE